MRVFFNVIENAVDTLYNNVETSKGEASSQGFVRDGQCDYFNVLVPNPYEVNAEKYEIP